MFGKLLHLTLAAVIAVFALSAGYAGAGGASPGQTSSQPPVPGGGALLARGPENLTATQRQQVQSKVAAAQAFVSKKAASPYYQSGNWYYSNNYMLKPEPDQRDNWGWNWSAGWYFNATHTYRTSAGSVPFPPSSGNNYDANFYYYLCGPGATTFTARSWSLGAVENYSNTGGDGEGKHSTDSAGDQVYGWGWGWYGYMYEAAYWEMTAGFGTYWYNLKNFLNNNVNGANTFVDDPWDEGYSPLTQSNFTADVNFDLADFGGAAIAEVDTRYMPEWTGSADHFVPVNGWNPTTSYVNWVDTAYQGGSGPNGNTFGNYNESASSFFKAIMGSLSSNDVIW